MFLSQIEQNNSPSFKFLGSTEPKSDTDPKRTDQQTYNTDDEYESSHRILDLVALGRTMGVPFTLDCSLFWL